MIAVVTCGIAATAFQSFILAALVNIYFFLNLLFVVKKNQVYNCSLLTQEIYKYHQMEQHAQDFYMYCPKCLTQEELDPDTIHNHHSEALFLIKWMKENSYYKQNIHLDGKCFFRVIWEALKDQQTVWNSVDEFLISIAKHAIQVFLNNLLIIFKGEQSLNG